MYSMLEPSSCTFSEVLSYPATLYICTQSYLIRSSLMKVSGTEVTFNARHLNEHKRDECTEIY